jgi:zinc protease
MSARAASRETRVFLEAAHDLPIVDLFVVCEHGSADDPEGREGALHVCLRSLRRGTARRSAHEIDALIDRFGAELSTQADATSSYLQATVLRRNLEPFLELMHDIVTAPRLPSDEVLRVAREIRAELIDAHDDDRALAGRYFRQALFAGHPFGRPSYGTPATMARLTRNDAFHAWERAFRRNNVLIAAAGDVRPAELERFARRTEEALPASHAAHIEVREPTPVRGRHLVIVDKPERTQTQVYIGNLGTRARDRDHAALIVANTIFGGTFTARLTREIRSKRGWSYGAASRLGRDRVRDAWSMWTFPSATDAPACIALQLKLLERLIEHGITARELAFAKSFLTKSYAFETDTPSKRLWQSLDQRLVDLPKRYFADYLARIEAVTLDEVNSALRRRLNADDLVLTVVATASQSRVPLERAIKNLASTRVVPFDAE